jgi:hypothetical protein
MGVRGGAARLLQAWDKEVRSARKFKRVGRHSEYRNTGYEPLEKRPRGFG